MDNETEMRFQRIEDLLLKISEGMDRNVTMQGGLVESISKYVDAADARNKRRPRRLMSAALRRIEDNLDALIRAITVEHSNGKGKV